MEQSEHDKFKETVLENLSMEGILKSLNNELDLSTKESIFYQRKIELLNQAIAKLKS